VPLFAAVATGSGGRLPAVRTGVRVLRPGVLVTAFGSSPALKGTLLRIWEVAGKSGNIVVKLPSGTAAKAAQPVDLGGRPRGRAIPVKNDSFELLIKAFAPASFESLALG
jgi:alpha-mannosidase